MTDVRHSAPGEGAVQPVRLTGAQVLVRLLETEAVPFVFGIVGGKLAPLLHALSRSAIPFVGVRHEAAAAMMAAAVHAGSGRVAVALGEMGPGGLNLASGAGVAFNNNLAALFITTNQHRAAAYPHQGMFMDMDTRAVLAPLVKWNAVVHDARRIPELVRRAFREALSGRPGPVHLDIPQDVLAAAHDWPEEELAVAPSRYRPCAGPRPTAAQVREAAGLLAGARRPLIVAGGGVVRAEAAAAVRALARRLRAPVVPTQMGLGVVASDSPHFVGHGGLIAGSAVARAFDQADVVVSLGCRHSSWMWDEHGPLVRRRHRMLNVNIDPSALGAPALHEIAMPCDVGQALEDVLAALQGVSVAAEPDWLPGLRQVRAGYEAALAAVDEAVEGAMHPAALAREIGRAMPPDAIAVFDGGHTSFWSNDLTPVQETRTRFHEPGMSHLGFGLPYALALKLLHPRRTVINITGDGSFGFTLQELDTARRQGLAVINIVHNNEAWGIIRSGQLAQWDFELGASLAGTDYAAIARGFGCHGETVSQPGDLAPALARALVAEVPAVLDCRTAFVPHPAMPAFGSMNRYGFEALVRPK
ncbi:carboligase [Pigmentiphaga sp. NML080357]|uniref:thiamine pyrophosphate-binding protein n=1 Tax=Pigmentiphaga sp. NML080357 TaxID=2008675 RepID=UPI000B40BC19|nr:thiamine pyrophosphate-binding protein [Pigmentiphaga sp. NML080357]OVZ59109.1 carboligase [Pigmentiphaga sp. NML080357]